MSGDQHSRRLCGQEVGDPAEAAAARAVVDHLHRGVVKGQARRRRARCRPPAAAVRRRRGCVRARPCRWRRSRSGCRRRGGRRRAPARTARGRRPPAAAPPTPLRAHVNGHFVVDRCHLWSSRVPTPGRSGHPSVNESKFRLTSGLEPTLNGGDQRARRPRRPTQLAWRACLRCSRSRPQGPRQRRPARARFASNPAAAADQALLDLLHHVLLANRFWLLTVCGEPFVHEHESRPVGSSFDAWPSATPDCRSRRPRGWPRRRTPTCTRRSRAR